MVAVIPARGPSQAATAEVPRPSSRPERLSSVGESDGSGACAWYAPAMSKAYKCPVCANEADSAATVCSNPACRAELAFCSHCRDISTYLLVEKRRGRDLYRCERCQRPVVKCYTWLSGGYCNGLARAGGSTGGSTDMPLCASCTTRAGEVARNIIGWTVIGALGTLVGRRK